MLDANEILTRVLYPVLRDTNESLPEAQRLKESPDMPLFGPGAPLDSMGLVRFLVEVEERVQGELDKEIRLVSDKAMSRRNSPFRTLQSLAEYVVELIQEEGTEQ